MADHALHFFATVEERPGLIAILEVWSALAMRAAEPQLAADLLTTTQRCRTAFGMGISYAGRELVAATQAQLAGAHDWTVGTAPSPTTPAADLRSMTARVRQCFTAVFAALHQEPIKRETRSQLQE